MGSLIGPTTGWTMGWLAAGFLALQPLLQRAMGAMLLVLLIGACGGLLAALVALGRGAFATPGRHEPAVLGRSWLRWRSCSGSPCSAAGASPPHPGGDRVTW